MAYRLLSTCCIRIVVPMPDKSDRYHSLFICTKSLLLLHTVGRLLSEVMLSSLVAYKSTNRYYSVMIYSGMCFGLKSKKSTVITYSYPKEGGKYPKRKELCTKTCCGSIYLQRVSKWDCPVLLKVRRSIVLKEPNVTTIITCWVFFQRTVHWGKMKTSISARFVIYLVLSLHQYRGFTLPFDNDVSFIALWAVFSRDAYFPVAVITRN